MSTALSYFFPSVGDTAVARQSNFIQGRTQRSETDCGRRDTADRMRGSDNMAMKQQRK